MEDTVKSLEEKIRHLEEQRLDRIEAALDQVIQNQRDMERELERYGARWGLLLMVGSAVLAALKLSWENIRGIFS